MEYDVKKSTHKAAVVEVRLEPHPNADSLSVVKVWGYEVCVKSSDWVGIEKAVYIMPDSVVDVKRPEFTFLAQDANSEGKARVKARRFRGSLSFGLLVPAPADASIGDDLASFFGVERYEPTMSRSKKDRFVIGGEEEAGPEHRHGADDCTTSTSFERPPRTASPTASPSTSPRSSTAPTPGSSTTTADTGSSRASGGSGGSPITPTSPSRASSRRAAPRRRPRRSSPA
jgi:tRNA-binding EMAP/Myf-like protein